MRYLLCLIVIIVAGCTPRMKFVTPGETAPYDCAFFTLEGFYAEGDVFDKPGLIVGGEPMKRAAELPLE